MKKSVLLIFSLFYLSIVYGQAVKFDKSGKINEAPKVLDKAEYLKLKDTFSNTLKVIDSDLKQDKIALINDIIERLETTIEALRKEPKQYQLLFEDLSLIDSAYSRAILDLKNFKKTIRFPEGIVEINLIDLPYISKALKKVWKDTTSVTPSLKTSFAEFKIYKPSLANLFYAEYYNLVYNDTCNNIYSGLKDIDLFTELNLFKMNLVNLEDKLQDPTYYEEAHQLAVEIKKKSLVFKLFREEWIEQLLWLNKGELRLNPFDNTSALILLNNPGWTLSNDKSYQDYLDAVIKRKTTFDSSGNYAVFKQILVEKNMLKSRNGFESVRDSLKKVAAQDFAKLKIGYVFLNLLKIPHELKIINEKYYRHIVVDNQIIEGDYENLNFLDSEKALTWTIHNKVQGQDIKLKELQKSVIKAEGKSEQEINRFFSEAADLYVVLNPSLSVFSKLIVDSKIPPYKTYNSNQNIKTSINFLNKILSNSTFNDTDQLKAKQLKEELENALKERSTQKGNKKNEEEIKQKFINDSLVLGKGRLYLNLIESSTLPPDPWGDSIKSKTPIYETKLLKTDELDTLNSYKYSVLSIIKKDTTTIDAVKFKVGKYVRFSLSGGLAYTLNPQLKNELIQDAQGNISFNNTSQSYRGIALFNLYFIGKGMLKPDDDFFPKKDGCGRLFWQLGVGIPEPLTNFYTGFGYNIGPGLLLSTGLHLSGQKRYEVVNNVVVEEQKIYQPNMYVSVSLDTHNLLKALGLFGK